MELPKNETTFQFEEIGETTGHKYEGRFTALCVLNIAMKHKLELEKTRLLADFANPTEGLNGIAITLAELRVRIIDAPEWWKQSGGGLDILDEDILVKLYSKLLEKQVEWKDSIKAKAKAMENPDPNAPTGSK